MATSSKRRVAGRLILFLALVTLGLGPALLVAYVQRQRPVDPWVVVTAAARAQARILDVHADRWQRASAQLAGELAAMLRPLGSSAIGQAAEGTLVLHLQARLGQQPDIGEYALYSHTGRLLLSTDETRASRPEEPAPFELAQAARRPATLLARAPDKTRGRSQLGLAVAAPIGPPSDVGPPRAVLLGRINTGATARLLDEGELAVRVVDGSGSVLGDTDGLSARAREELGRLGTESRPGRLLLGGRPSAYYPLARARAVVVVSATLAPLPSPLRTWHLGLLGVVIALAALGSTILGRTPTPRGDRGSP